MNIKLLILILFCLSFFSGCVGPTIQVDPMQSYNSLSGPYKAKAVAVYKNFTPTGGGGWSSGSTLYEARQSALNNCKRFNPNFDCIIEFENDNYVFLQSVNKFQKEQFMVYLEQKKNSCFSYGYKDGDALAMCVEREVNADRQKAIAQQNTQQYQNTPSRTYNWGAISDLGKCISDGSCWNTGNQASINSAPQATSMRYFLMNQSRANNLIYCKYSGGHVTTISFGLCPQSIVR